MFASCWSGGGAVDGVVHRQRPPGRSLHHRLLGEDEVADGGRRQVGRGGIVLAPVPRARPVPVVRAPDQLTDPERGLGAGHGDDRVEPRLVGRVVVGREPALRPHRFVDDERAVARLRRGEREARPDPALDRGVGVGDLSRRPAVPHDDGEVPSGLRSRRPVRRDHQLHRLGDGWIVAEVGGGGRETELGRAPVHDHAGDVEVVLEVEAELPEPASRPRRRSSSSRR